MNGETNYPAAMEAEIAAMDQGEAITEGEVVAAYRANGWGSLNSAQQKTLRLLADGIAHDAFRPQAD